MRALVNIPDNLISDLAIISQAKKLPRAELIRQAISLTTWMEVMIGATAETANDTKLFLASFTLLPIDDAVVAQALVLRQTARIKLPDAKRTNASPPANYPQQQRLCRKCARGNGAVSIDLKCLSHYCA